MLLKKGSAERATEETASIFDRIMTIFEFLSDKDVFAKFYRTQLMKRLIHSTSAGDDDEELMLTKLREKCGYEYVAKFQRMMQDKQTNKRLNDDFKNWVQENSVSQIETSVQVLSTGSWPSHAIQVMQQFNWPQEFQNC